jgi:hypothetical protein
VIFSAELPYFIVFDNRSWAQEWWFCHLFRTVFCRMMFLMGTGRDLEAVDLSTNPEVPKFSKWHSFSGLFILLKRRNHLSRCVLRQTIKVVFNVFVNLVLGKNVRSFVPT